MNDLNNSVVHSSPLNVGIIGLGAIGCLVGSQMPNHYNLYALPSKPNLKNIHFQLDEPEHSNHYSIPVWQNEPLDVIIICCKATQCLSAISLWKNAISDHSQIVLLQNGMGQHELIASKFPNNDIFAASTTEGAYKKDHAQSHSRQHIVHAGQGITQWGYYSGPAMPTKSSNQAQPKFKLEISQLTGQHKWHHNIAEVLFAKLALNVVINPLTVIHNCKNGDLLNDSARIQELEDLCEETEKFFTAMQWPLSEDLTKKVKSVATLTANNISSMLQDIQACRETEINFINGYLINKARAINYSLPLHERLLAYINSL